jgi:hypothetical protein
MIFEKTDNVNKNKRRGALDRIHRGPSDNETRLIYWMTRRIAGLVVSTLARQPLIKREK